MKKTMIISHFSILFISIYLLLLSLFWKIIVWLVIYINNQDTLRDGVIDAKEIEQWRQILNEYEESLKEITTP